MREKKNNTNTYLYYITLKNIILEHFSSDIVEYFIRRNETEEI